MANIWQFDPVLRHLLCLDQECVTMETRNLKLDTLMLHASSFSKIQVYEILQFIYF